MSRSTDQSLGWQLAAWGPSPVLGPLSASLNLVGLGLLTFGIASSGRLGFSGRPLVMLILFGLATASWLGWTASRTWALSPWALPTALVVMAVAGAALTGFASLGMVFPAVAALGATLSMPGRRAALVILTAALALAVFAPIGGQGVGTELGGVSAVLGGAVMGMTRRAAHERQQQEANVRIAEARTDAERARAELLAGRNHLARELHDVLAHTLSALSLQLEALDALMPDGPPSPQVAAQLAEIRRLVHDGLDEARGAVAALREDLPPLDERVRKLAAERGVTAIITGQPRPLPADVSLALYRVAQEALTNVVRHAPGTVPRVTLDLGPETVTLDVTNPAADPNAGPSLAARGGGYGLQGIRERILLIGGTVEAGPVESPDGPSGGWRVLATVPVPA